MNIIEDTRNKVGKHITKNAYFEVCGDTVTRSKLPWGDYAVAPSRAVDTKESIYELAQDINQDHNRFRNELVDARDNGCQLYILTENEANVGSVEDLEQWVEDYTHYKMRMAKNPRAKRFSGKTLARACRTLSERYGARFMFCTPASAGAVIRAILGGEDGK